MTVSRKDAAQLTGCLLPLQGEGSGKTRSETLLLERLTQAGRNGRCWKEAFTFCLGPFLGFGDSDLVSPDVHIFYMCCKVPQRILIPAGCLSINKGFIQIPTVLIVIIAVITIAINIS